MYKFRKITPLMSAEKYSEYDLEAIISYMEQSVEKKPVKKNDFFSEEDELGKYIRLKCCNKRYYTMLDYLDHREEVHGEMLERFENPCKFISSYEAKPKSQNQCVENKQKRHFKESNVSTLSFEEEIRPYKCSVSECPKRYKNSNGLKYHMSHKHVGEEEREL